MRGAVLRRRGVSLSPSGTRIAGLLSLRTYSDTRYSYDVFVGDVGDDAAPPIALPGERACGVAWTPDSERLVLTGTVGFRVHEHGGALVRADESPKGWTAARVTADGRRVYFIRRDQLGCLALDTLRALPAPDISPIAPPPNEISWHADGLALSRAGDHLSVGRRGGGLHVWDLASSSAVAELRWEGPRVFRTKAVFAPDGARLVASFHHVIAPPSDGRVTHVLYDLRDRRVVGGVVTQTESTGFHATACFSADGRRLYVSEGHRVHVCDVG